MLTVKINIDQSKENYQAVVQALAEFDIISASWETDQSAAVTLRSGVTDPSDLAANLSAATNTMRKRQSDL